MTKNNATAALATEPAERTEVAEHKNIGEAFLAIMKEVGYVQKLGKNTAQNYKYAGEAQLIEALRPALIRHGVICIPSEAKSRDTVVVTPALLVDGKLVDKEKKTYRTVIDYTFVYTHVSSATHIQVQVIGEGVDTGDKAAYKAATGALKYALRQPFLIETGDEPEAHDLPDTQAKVKTAFGTKAARDKFEQRMLHAIDNSPDEGELRAVWEDATKELALLKSSECDDDNYTYASLLRAKDLAKTSIAAARAMNGGE